MEYSAAVDEDTDFTDIAQRVAFIRGDNEDFQLVVELLNLLPLKGTTGGKFSELVTLFSKYELSREKWLDLFVTGLRVQLGKVTAMQQN
jgi:hypothetical protein